MLQMNGAMFRIWPTWTIFGAVQLLGIAATFFAPLLNLRVAPLLYVLGFYLLLPGSVVGPVLVERFLWGHVSLLQDDLIELFLGIVFNAIVLALVLKVLRAVRRQ
jgi:hypothetical protein